MIDWRGITYPSFLQHTWVQHLWRRFCCRRGWHLWDEYATAEDHGLFCDACGLVAHLCGFSRDIPV